MSTSATLREAPHRISLFTSSTSRPCRTSQLSTVGHRNKTKSLSPSGPSDQIGYYRHREELSCLTSATTEGDEERDTQHNHPSPLSSASSASMPPSGSAESSSLKAPGRAAPTSQEHLRSRSKTQSPPQKRPFDSEDRRSPSDHPDQETGEGNSRRKAVKVESGPSALHMRQRTTSDPEDKATRTLVEERGPMAERHYTWQPSPHVAAPGSIMSITSISSPTRRAAKEGVTGESGEGKDAVAMTVGSLSPSQSGSNRLHRIESGRLPGIASLSSRPTSPPPQVARINAPRSFVSVGSSSNLGASTSRLPFSSNSSVGSQHGPPSPRPRPSQGSYGGQYGQHGSQQTSYGLQPAGTSVSSLSASAASIAHQTAQGCPPIHPSLIGLPGSGTGPGNKQQPSFVAKLYSMLEDEATGSMISWGPSGDVFSVANPAEFSRVVLPTWFKHANWQSFVRQLNMYGFHKVNHTFSGAPNEEVQIWEFKHSSFRRGEVHLLTDIKRKSSRHKRTGSQSHSFSGSLHGLDYDGRLRSRSSTPLEAYTGDVVMQGGAVHPDAMSQDPRLRAYPHATDVDFREPGIVAHARVRSLTDAAMRRPPPRGIPQASTDTSLPRSGLSGGAALPPSFAGGARLAGPGMLTSAPGLQGHLRSTSITSASQPLALVETTEAANFERMQELSDRMDAVIRHAGFLEHQVKILSDQVAVESSARVHASNILTRLVDLYLVSPGEDVSPAAAEQMRRQVLDICHSELAHIIALPVREWSRSPPGEHRQWMDVSGPSALPPSSHRYLQHQTHRSEGSMRMLAAHRPASPEGSGHHPMSASLQHATPSGSRTMSGLSSCGPHSAYIFPPKRG